MKKLLLKTLLSLSFSILTTTTAFTAVVTYDSTRPDSINCEWTCADGTTGNGWEANEEDCMARGNASCEDGFVNIDFHDGIHNTLFELQSAAILIKFPVGLSIKDPDGSSIKIISSDKLKKVLTIQYVAKVGLKQNLIINVRESVKLNGKLDPAAFLNSLRRLYYVNAPKGREVLSISGYSAVK